ncbi:hypothetical protein BWI96_01105 [Siphonobacter sp. SORGH_AS_0500]|uniref:hypothetical protein n=1 Tax=Siphonobacter sp. SORGH_AS_0500 TaxID=1864824 RepID=UPI000CCB09A4|nr:hypothetical protein [Siphonobacter sp. SORGH_AS_0500]PKK38403.1 hypothetical protein BWI96_01105 [Siphonobacter sp. SORGH_AS_0500]
MNYIKSLVIFVALVGLFSSCTKDTPQDTDELSYLYQTWKHSTEEDVANERIVYRNASYGYPNTNLRQTFTFTESDVQVSVITNAKLTTYKGSYTVVMNGNSVKEITINYTETGQKIPTVLRYEVLILANDALILKQL